MSARARKPPTTEPPDRPSLDDQPTTIFDSDEYPPKRRAQSPALPTVVDRPELGAHPTPRVVDKPAASRAAPTVFAKPGAGKAAAKEQASAPIQMISKKEASSPMQAISMKTPGNQKPAAPDNPPTPILARPKLRAVSEVTPAKQQQNLGNLASPYDPREARARAMREYVIWGCLAVILASAIALVVWFVAR
jgi:hypothetical protein